MSELTTTANSYQLLVTHESGSTTKHPLEPGRSVVLGSSPHCGIHVSGQDVANMHCLIDLNDGVLGIQDWASPTGTIVNGKAIAAKMPISENDEVRIGKASIRIHREVNSAASEGETPLESDELELVTEQDDQEDASIDLGGDQEETYSEVYAEDVIIDAEKLNVPDPVVSAPSADEASELDLPTDDHDWHADFEESSQASTDWETGQVGLEAYDAETVQLLKDEIEDLRSMLADRDRQVEELSSVNEFTAADCRTTQPESEAHSLQQRVDQLLAEAADNDERFQILHDLLESAELKNQAEHEERLSLEHWVGEIEHRIGQRESEWKAEIEAVRERLKETEDERNQLQHKLREVASRFGAQDVYRETLDKLQTRTAELQEQLVKAQRQAATYKQQLDNVQNRESDAVQEERALIAKERAAVSRMRHELSAKLSEFDQTDEPKNSADREVALRIRTLRTHLREIHEQEKEERDQRGESLFSRISGMWKRMDDEF